MKKEFSFADDTQVTIYLVQTLTINSFSGSGNPYWTRPTAQWLVKATNKIIKQLERPTRPFDGTYSFRTEADAKLMAKSLSDFHPRAQFRIVKVEPTVIT
jgi:hypothetical protein